MIKARAVLALVWLFRVGLGAPPIGEVMLRGMMAKRHLLALLSLSVCATGCHEATPADRHRINATGGRARSR